MQKVTIYCDRCNCIITEEEDPVTIQFWNRHYSQVNEDRQIRYDLCRECRDDFKKFMKEKPEEKK